MPSGKSPGTDNHWTFITPRAYNSDGTFYCEGVDGEAASADVVGHDGVDIAICRRSLVHGSCCRRSVSIDDSSTLEDLVVTSVDNAVVAYNCLVSKCASKSNQNNQTNDSTACASEVPFHKARVSLSSAFLLHSQVDDVATMH